MTWQIVILILGTVWAIVLFVYAGVLSTLFHRNERKGL